MDNRDKDKPHKYMTLYMCIGMSLGTLVNIVFNGFDFSIAYGMMLGMTIGIIIGSAKDKRLSENMMKISRIMGAYGSSDMSVYAIDKNGVEKEYRVSEKMMKQEKFSVGNRVAEDTNGSLVTLESN